MPETTTTRTVGRIDKVRLNKSQQQWGTLLTEDWIEWSWNSDEIKGGVSLRRGDIVGFDPAPAPVEGSFPRAVNIELLEKDGETVRFAALAKFLKNRHLAGGVST